MISFYLKHQDRPSIVSLRYRYRGKIVQYSTGMMVDPDDWDRSRQRIKGRRTNSTSRNGYLDRLEKAMIDAHDELMSAGRIDANQLKAQFQRMNRQLKEICKLAGINDVHMLDGIARKKYELVSTHTARRSFATNAYRAGIPSISIMKITGHSTERSFMKYIKISQEENARLMLKNPFFKGLKAL